MRIYLALLLLTVDRARAARPGAVDLHPIVDLLQQLVDRPAFVWGMFGIAVAASTVANLLASAIKTGAKVGLKRWQRQRTMRSHLP